VSAPPAPPPELLDTIGNLARFHREHELFYSQAPLRHAIELEASSRALKALAEHWTESQPVDRPAAVRFAGAEDLNAPGLVSATGILFMEGEGEPAEIAGIKGDIEALAAGSERTGAWLSEAMEQTWQMAGALVGFPQVADLLAERHLIISHDWHAAYMNSIASRVLRRALDLLGQIDFSPAALRADLAEDRHAPRYLYSASELLDHAADLFVQSATLVHENERRWRVFGARVRELRESVRIEPEA
jgi:hypothetical protein